ncbi:MAG: hypothetical protein AB7O97_04725 [Planctomycetota bacterium]
MGTAIARLATASILVAAWSCDIAAQAVVVDHVRHVGVVPLARLEGRVLVPVERPDGAARLLSQLRSLHRLSDEPIDFAHGVDLQLLLWLRDERLDAAQVSLGLAVLDRELAQSLRQKLPRSPSAELSPVADRLVLRDATRPDAQREELVSRFRSAVRQLWQHVRGGANGPGPDLQLEMPGIASLRGCVVPVLSAAECLLETELTFSSDVEARERFWAAWFGRVRFLPPGTWSKPDPPDRDDAVDRWRFSFATDTGSADDLAAAGYAFGAETLADTAPELLLMERRGHRLQLSRHDAAARDYRFVHRLAGALSMEMADASSSGIAWMRQHLAVPAEIGFSQRFAPDEALLLVRHDQLFSGVDALALVLPGGGVKAAYQSAAIDWLYDTRARAEPRLWNRRAADQAPAAHGDPLLVQWIIGNSGGALLGAFVSLLSESVPRAGMTLIEALWKEDDGHGNREFIDSTRVLPHIDMLRWASLLLTCLVVSGCLVLLRPFVNLGSPSSASAQALAEHRRWRFRSAAVWMVLLVSLPWFIKRVGGREAAEHVPVVQGFVYFVCIALAVYRDQVGATAERSAARLGLAWMVVGLGGAVMATMLVRAYWPELSWVSLGTEWLDTTHSFSSVRISGRSILASLAGVAVFAGVFLLLGCLGQRDPIGADTAARRVSYALIVAPPFLTWAVLLLLHDGFDLRCLPMLELAPGFFWRWAVLSAAVAVILFVAVWVKHERGADGVRYLLRYDAGRWTLMPRHLRMTAYFLMAWVWWNAVMAPALYGNQDARGYLRSRIRDFAGQPRVMQAALVAPAVNLDSQDVRYFELDPFREEVVTDRPAGWVQLKTPEQLARGAPTEAVHHMDDVILASGSPYPVFPPHLVDYADATLGGGVPANGSGQGELLVDGGYAHNIPVGAARVVGARQLLIIGNVPHVDEVDETYAGTPLLGTLLRGMPRLLPFLWDRAQVSDRERNDDLFVVRTWPRPRADGGWFSLVDFRRETIEELAQLGTEDFRSGHRIAVVEAWGRPVFRTRY